MDLRARSAGRGSLAAACDPALQLLRFGLLLAGMLAMLAAGIRAQSGPPPAWITKNVTFLEFSQAQGLIAGTPAWEAGGLDAFSGITGGHPAYGWCHDHLVAEQWAHAVTANYCARPAYYQAAPLRESGYFLGSRPVGWDPVYEPNSVGSGESMGAQLVDGIAVSGPDMEHFALSPVFALARSTGITLPLPGPGNKTIAADVAAETMLRYLMAAQAGMVRTPSGGVIEFVCSDRSARYIIGNLATAQEFGCIDAADAATLNLYIATRLLPHWMAIPSAEPGKGGNLQVYNGVYWVVPALYDLLMVTPPGAYRRDILTALQMLSLRLAFLALLVPGKACQVEAVTTWVGLTPAGVTTHDYLGPWGTRAQLVAGKVLGLPMCTQEGLAEAALWSGDWQQKAWMVAPDGSYL
jgi:hypothetical protein